MFPTLMTRIRKDKLWRGHHLYVSVVLLSIIGPSVASPIPKPSTNTPPINQIGNTVNVYKFPDSGHFVLNVVLGNLKCEGGEGKCVKTFNLYSKESKQNLINIVFHSDTQQKEDSASHAHVSAREVVESQDLSTDSSNVYTKDSSEGIAELESPTGNHLPFPVEPNEEDVDIVSQLEAKDIVKNAVTDAPNRPPQSTPSNAVDTNQSSPKQSMYIVFPKNSEEDDDY